MPLPRSRNMKCRKQLAMGHGEDALPPKKILDYAESDVEALTQLLFAMLPGIDLPRALFRGRYMAAAAAMEHHGTPIDVRSEEHTSELQSRPHLVCRLLLEKKKKQINTKYQKKKKRKKKTK